ncbi:MAG: hypothetical protein Q9160_002959 [Pyrenula sp. 1 TL-2023]
MTCSSDRSAGIGFAIVHLLAIRSPNDHFLLGVRDLKRGKDAINRLNTIGINSEVDLVQIDITSDESIRDAEREIRTKHGKLDVLINNAAIALPENDLSTLRTTYQTMFSTNVASLVLIIETFLPLLKSTSADPRIIQISSARGSLTRTQQSLMPPPWSLSYGATKAALNLVTLELSRKEGNVDVVFQCVSPGHCRTDFNGNRGKKEPIEGAKVVAELVLEARDEAKKRQYGLWEIEGEDTEPTLVPW